jgi:hypothetical protein
MPKHPSRAHFLTTQLMNRVSGGCAICEKTVTQQRYPGRHPQYCSVPCEEEGRREKTRERVKKLRAHQRLMQKRETGKLPQEKM